MSSSFVAMIIDRSQTSPSTFPRGEIGAPIMASDGQAFLREVWALQATAYVIVSLRYYQRISTLGWHKLAWDDAFMVLATVSERKILTSSPIPQAVNYLVSTSPNLLPPLLLSPYLSMANNQLMFIGTSLSTLPNPSPHTS